MQVVFHKVLKEAISNNAAKQNMTLNVNSVTELALITLALEMDPNCESLDIKSIDGKEV